MKANLISPYGGKLVNLVVDATEREELLNRASELSSIKITMRNLCDLELLATGGFSPLTTFMGKADYDRVLREMRPLFGELARRRTALLARPGGVALHVRWKIRRARQIEIRRLLKPRLQRAEFDEERSDRGVGTYAR